AEGRPLGRRIVGQCRVVLKMEKPDPENQPNRRKLSVVKSNSLYPVALGITMGDHGNEYDDKPPFAPTSGMPGSGGPSPKVKETMDWLEEFLGKAPQRVSEARKAAEQDGISGRNLYRARDALGVTEFEEPDRKGKWWSLPAAPAADEEE